MQQHLTVGFDEIDLVIECSACSSKIVIANPEPEDIVDASVYDRDNGVRCPSCGAVTIAINTPGRQVVSDFGRLLASVSTHVNDKDRNAALQIRVPLDWAIVAAREADPEPTD